MEKPIPTQCTDERLRRIQPTNLHTEYRTQLTKLMAPVDLPASTVSALVWESLHPLQEIYGKYTEQRLENSGTSRLTTSAALVFVARAFFSARWLDPVAVFKIPETDEKTLPCKPLSMWFCQAAPRILHTMSPRA